MTSSAGARLVVSVRSLPSCARARAASPCASSPCAERVVRGGAAMGAASSRVAERVLGAGDEPAPAAATRTWGLENFGNTCYANSVLQALYACAPFRERALVYHAERSAAKADPDEHLLAALAELFASVRPRAACAAWWPRAECGGARRSQASARRRAVWLRSVSCSG